MTTPVPSQVKGHRHWWLKALLASAALAGLLVGLYTVTPVAIRAYYARRWRNTSVDDVTQKIYDVRDLTGKHPRFTKPLVTEEGLLAEVRALIGQYNWPKDKTRLEVNAGRMNVVQSPDAHVKIGAFLDEKRKVVTQRKALLKEKSKP
jgi:hypothetical protein